MYSVVLMMAMTTGAETPDCHKSSCGCAGYTACAPAPCATCAPVACGCGGGGHRLFGKHRGCGGCGASTCSSCAPAPACGCVGGYYGPGYAVPPGPGPKPGEGIKEMPKPGKPEVYLPTPATLVVSLPENATLTINGAPTQATSAERVFTSPELAPQVEYFYTLRAEVVRDGKALAIEQKVAVRAGMESRVTLAIPEGVASR